jgi:hypothetical protein
MSVNYEEISQQATDPLFELAGDRIENLGVWVDHVKITGEGKLEIKLTAEAVNGEALSKVRDLLLIQRSGVLVDFRPTQESLPL